MLSPTDPVGLSKRQSLQSRLTVLIGDFSRTLFECKRFYTCPRRNPGLEIVIVRNFRTFNALSISVFVVLIGYLLLLLWHLKHFFAKSSNEQANFRPHIFELHSKMSLKGQCHRSTQSPWFEKIGLILVIFSKKYTFLVNPLFHLIHRHNTNTISTYH